MSLYGALFGGVSGLAAQSSKIGTISDNIANVNTVGYKQATATFSSLVVNSSSAVSFQTGGVRAGTRLDIDKQGLLQSTQSPTDLAISGGGFFVVRSVPDGSVGGTAATPLYTRAGSFSPDALGNFVNAQGQFLQGWPLDRDGRLPGEVGNPNTTAFTNFDSLKPVNVETASGVAQGTSTLALGANLKASEVIFPGESGTLLSDASNAANLNLAADKIYVGSEFGLASADSSRRGDQFSVSTGNGLQFNYEFGGFTIGRSITTPIGANNFGDAGADNTASIALSAASDIKFDTGSSFLITIPSHGLIGGDQVTLTGFAAAVGATPASELNAQHVVQRVDADTLRITVSTAHGGVAGANAGPGVGPTADTRQFQGNVLDASSATQTFLGQTGTASFTTASQTFTITTATTGTQTFRYSATAPNTLSGEFNNLNSLASAIDSVNGLTARVTSGRLVVGAEDASQAVTFANGDAVGTSTQRGIDWLEELDLSNIAIGNRRFSSLQGLANLVNSDDGVSAVVNSPLSSATLDIRVDDPLDTITFSDVPDVNFSIPVAGTPIAIPAGTFPVGSAIDLVITDAAQPATLNPGDSVYISGLTNGLGGLPGAFPNGGPYQVIAKTAGTYTVRIPAPAAVTLAGGNFAAAAANKVSIAGESNQGSLLAHLGMVTSLGGAAYTPQTTGVLGPRYDPTGAIGKNLASGDITAQFSRNVRIFDSLGSGHDLRFSFIKIADNSWGVEVHSIPETDVSTSLVDGQVVTGTINFNGDGTLRSISSSLSAPFSINWTNGAIASDITLNLGTAGQPFGTVGAATTGLSDGLSQFDSAYNVNFANQNGAPVGQLVSVAIDKDGIVNASYSNGQTQRLFKIPLASFANPNGLEALSGNIFTQTRASGEVNLREANTNGTGTIVAAALEQSNVDLAEQLTDIIVAQRSYQANTKVIKTVDQLLDDLNRI
ncbi:MAG: flagellar hook-basal body complex protein [Alphaproteobacteria bacterium]|nr:flagellar hook-basal body complex protein [Alphaproteobacteria bacterium]